MDKHTADCLISQYRNKIFGFALSKLRDYSQAEELAAEISCRTYLSFLRADDIPNPDGYVYRVACNVFANFLKNRKNTSYEDISQLSVPHYDETQEKLENDETLKRLRSEIGYLTQRQRTIVYMFYYEKRTVAQISSALDISPGTVKWHLSDARTTLKEGIEMNENTTATVNPIKFISMGHDGSAGTNGDTSNIFNTRLKQNIAFSCYWKSKTIEEIARELGVPVTYVSDEMKILEEYGYIDRQDKSANPKYLTNMYITDERLFDDTESKLAQQAAEYLAENLYTKVFADFDCSEDCYGFKCDGNDRNFMKYSLVMLCHRYLFCAYDIEQDIYEKFSVKRPDGGDFIAHATASDDCRNPENNISKDDYWCCGYMTRANGKAEDAKNMHSIQINCKFSDRDNDWRENKTEDWISLYKFVTEGKNCLSPEEYKRICDKGYIFEDRNQIMSLETTNVNDVEAALSKLIRNAVSVPDDIKKYSAQYDNKIYEINKKNYPPQMQELVKAYSKGSLMSGQIIPRVIDVLLKKGLLQPITPQQKKAVFSVMVYKMP
ncbi:MAG: sigma-70 family RNA polymerase sigma factor [Ruminococcus sp.]|nr:sigma-70 family RNA polymerase sigma factor [Ruminococcus sp.]